MASGAPADVEAALAAWRASGADRADPARFCRIESLARRAAGHEGEARRLLDDRLAGLLEEYGRILDCAAPRGAAATVRGPARARVPAGPLAGLARDIARRSPWRVGDGPDGADPAGGPAPMPGLPGAMDLPAWFRETWARLRADRQLRQALEQVPGNAGPLNSNRVAHRALRLMHELSPEYLRGFVAYVDALSGLEQAFGEGAPAGAARKGRGKGR